MGHHNRKKQKSSRLTGHFGMERGLRLSMVSAAIISTLMPNLLHATTYYYDNNGATAGFGTAGGTWGATGLWSTSSTGTSAVPGVTTILADDLNFGTATAGLALGTITVNGTQNFNSMTFGSASGAITLSGGTLNLTNANTLFTVNNASTFIASDVISSVLSGTGGLSKSGTGILTLSGSNSNTYGGVTIINAGTIVASKNAGIVSIAGNDITLNNTLATNLWFVNDNQLSGTATLTFANNAGSHGRFMLEGTTQSVAGINNNGTASGVVQNSESAFGGSPSNTGTGTLVLTGSGTYSFAGFLRNQTGTLQLTQNGTGSQILSGTNISYTGATTINSGVLNLVNTTSMASSTTVNTGGILRTTNTANSSYGSNFRINLAGGTFEHNQNFFSTFSGLFTVSADSTINTFNTSGTTQAYFDGGATGSGTLNIINSGGGTDGGVVFRNNSAGNSLSGTVTVQSGVIGYGNSSNALNSAQLILNGAKLVMVNSTNGVSITNTNETLGSLASDGTSTIVSNTQLTVGGINGSTDFAGVYSGTGSFVKIGSGIQTLSGANTFTGITSLNAGTLNLSNALALQNSTLTMVGGSVVFDSLVLSNAFTLGGLAGSGNVVLQNNAATPAAIALTVGGNGSSTTYSGSLSGLGSLIKTGAGVLTLSGTNTYTGFTTLNDGILKLSHTNALQGSTLTMAGGSVVFDSSVLSNAFTLGGLAGSGDVALQNNAATPAAIALTVGGNDSSTTYSGALSGLGSLIKTGTGVLILSGTNTYGGATTISDGTLQIGGASTSSSTQLSSGAVSIASGAMLTALTTGTFSFDNALLTGAGTLNASNNNSAFSFGAGAGSAFTGTAALSNNTFALSGNNTTALTNASLSLGSGNVTTVGTGNQTIGGLVFNGGTATFAVELPGDKVSASTITTTNTLDVSGTGTVRISLPTGGWDNSQPLPSTQLPLLEQDDGSVLVKLVNLGAMGTINGTAGALTLADASGNAITSAQTIDITQGGFNVAQGTYDYRLSTSTANDGLYVSYGLTQVNLIGTGSDALILAPSTGATGVASDLSAKLTGSGDLNIVAGSGNTVSLSNTLNDYTGATTVTSGTLQLGVSNALGQTSALTIDTSSAVDLNGKTQAIGSFTGQSGSSLNVNGGAFTINNGGTSDGTLTGVGTMVLGGGTLIVNGANTSLTADVSIDLGAGATLSNIAGLGNAGTLTDNGTLTFDGANGTFSKALAGSGAMELTSSANVTLTNNNTSYTGTTTINGGSTLQIGNGGNTGSLGGGAIVDNGALVFNLSSSSTVSNVISGAGSLTANGPGALLLSGVSTYSGATAVNSGVLTVGTTGAIMNSSQLSISAGAVVDNQGQMQGFTTANNAGTLINNGTLTAGVLTNSAGARISGNGTIVGSLVNNGTISPGNSIGTLTVNGQLTFNSGSVYEVEVNTLDQSDRINADTAVLNGGTVKVLASFGSYTPAIIYTILHTQNGVTGVFNNATADLAFLAPVLTYDAYNVYLEMMRNDVSFSSIGATFNQRATGNGVESLGVGNVLNDTILMLSVPQAQEAFNQLSGEVNASIKTGLIEESRLVRDAIIDRLRAAFDDVGAVKAPVVTYDFAGRSEVVDATSDRLALWLTPFGDWGHQDGNGNAAALGYSTGGLFLGADSSMPYDWKVGVLTGYSRTQFDVQDRSSPGDSDNYYAGAYAGKHWNKLALRTGVAYNWSDISDKRAVVFPGLNNALTNRMGAGMIQAFGELGYGVKMKKVAVEPFANLAYINLNSNDFQEKGGIAALTGQGNATNTAFSTLGLRTSTRFMLRNTQLIVRSALGWQHAFGDVVPLTTMLFAGGVPFTIAGTPLTGDAVVIGAGLDAPISSNMTVGLAYSGQFGVRLADQTAKANFKYVF